MVKRDSAPRLPAAERRLQILEAVLPVFARRGLEGAGTRDLAAAARVSEPLLYRHFGDKLGLYVEVYRDAERRVAEVYRSAVDSPGTRQARLLAVLDAAVTLHGQDESVPLFLASVPLDIRRHPELRTAVTKVPIETPAILARLVATPDGRSTTQLVTLISSVTTGMALMVGEGGHAAYAKTLRACGEHLLLDPP